MGFKGKKVAFVFPGQGSQYIGMGMDFLNYVLEIKNYDFQSIFDGFKEKTGFDLLSIMRDGPEETLKETRFTQPAILAHSIMALQTFNYKLSTINFQLSPDYVAGHSLGEFSALVANGVIDLADALYLVHKRGEFMIKANDDTPFAMAAVMGLDPETIKTTCEEASKQHLVVAANYNTPIQTVISGTAQGVELASTMLKERGAKRVMPLPVGGAFHSPLVAKASQWLADEMKNITFKDTQIPVICNVNALPETNAQKIVQNLTDQVTSSVQWVKSIKYIANQGVEIYIEFGPQKVLSGMITKIVDNAIVYNIDKYEDIQKVIDNLINGE